MQRPELARTGVHLLTGPKTDSPDTQQLYIGEGDVVGTRLEHHNQPEEKDFWERTLVVTSKDQNITKAHVRYLEASFIAFAKASGIADVANKQVPSPPPLPEADLSDMEAFTEHVQLVLPLLGFDFLGRPKVARQQSTDSAPGKTSPKFRLTSKGRVAHAHEVDGEFVVLKDSRAAMEWTGKGADTYKNLHARLVAAGKLTPHPDGGMRFSEDVGFKAPSPASAVILGRNDNGRTSWKVDGSTLNYGEWHSQQLTKSH